jgi:ABC-type molybdate transport system substrate-binding protein
MILAMLAMTGPAAADTIQLFAAGSLKAALTDVAKAYEATSGNKIEARYGPSGLLKSEILNGTKADIFASANMEHPQALRDEKKSGPVSRFARNTLCALVKPGLKVDSGSLLDRMLDPGIKLGTSTPKADPSGDYAFEAFRKAEAVKPGAQAILEKKALQLTGSANSATAPMDARSMAGTLRKHARIFSSPIAPTRWRPRKKTPDSRSCSSRPISPSAPTTA